MTEHKKQGGNSVRTPTKPAQDSGIRIDRGTKTDNGNGGSNNRPGGGFHTRSHEKVTTEKDGK